MCLYVPGDCDAGDPGTGPEKGMRGGGKRLLARSLVEDGAISLGICLFGIKSIVLPERCRYRLTVRKAKGNDFSAVNKLRELSFSSSLISHTSYLMKHPGNEEKRTLRARNGDIPCAFGLLLCHAHSRLFPTDPRYFHLRRDPASPHGVTVARQFPIFTGFTLGTAPCTVRPETFSGA